MKIPTALEVTVTCTCISCDAEVAVDGKLSNIAAASGALRSRMENRNWQPVRYGKKVVGVVCHECCEGYAGEDDADQETDEEDQHGTKGAASGLRLLANSD